MNIDTIIERIDNELLNLHLASKKGGIYKMFDFYQAIFSFNKAVLKEKGSNDEFYKSKSKNYRDVFKDLLFTESMAKWSIPISYNQQTRILKREVSISISNEIGVQQEEINDSPIKDDQLHNYYINNLEKMKNKRPKVYSVNKYEFLVAKCRMENNFKEDNISNLFWVDNFRNEFKKLFKIDNLELKNSQSDYDLYIEELLFEKEVLSKEDENVINKIPRLQTNLIPNQRAKLFELLVDGGFIDENKDCFNWALNVTNEEQTKQPDQWKKIQWKKSKTAFVELFKSFCETITSRPTNRIIGKLFLDEFGEDLKNLKTPKKDDVSACYGEICSIIDKLKIKNIPHSSNKI
jgi:hypothetical protein